jgi:hypothetical protein
MTIGSPDRSSLSALRRSGPGGFSGVGGLGSSESAMVCPDLERWFYTEVLRGGKRVSSPFAATW